MTQYKRIGIDTSKAVFTLHGIDHAERPTLHLNLRRTQMISFFNKLPPTGIALEACGGAHHWARELTTLGHEVHLLHARSRRHMRGAQRPQGQARGRARQSPSQCAMGWRSLRSARNDRQSRQNLASRCCCPRSHQEDADMTTRKVSAMRKCGMKILLVRTRTTP